MFRPPFWVPLLLVLTACDRLPLVRVAESPVAPVVDGRLDDAAWSASAPLVLRSNRDGSPVTPRTTARVVRHGDALYVGFECEDTDVWGTLTGRDDDIWAEECVEVFLDPAGDGKHYLEVEVSPRGTVFDAWIEFGPSIDFKKAKTFDPPSLRAAVQVDGTLEVRDDIDRGWSAEIEIPLNELPAAAGRTVRLNLYRIEFPAGGKQQYQAWSPTHDWFHVPAKFGRAAFKTREQGIGNRGPGKR